MTLDSSDYWYLCWNCGFVTPFSKWRLMKWDIEAEEADAPLMIPVEDGDSDPICVCPVCEWEHEDNDSGPGILDGTYQEMVSERQKSEGKWIEHWQLVWEEVFDRPNPEERERFPLDPSAPKPKPESLSDSSED